MSTPLLGTRKQPTNLFKRALNLLLLTWEFQESNIPTFLLPNSLFGLLGALSGTLLVLVPGTGAGSEQLDLVPEVSPLAILLRFPLVFLFNFLNNLTFDLANQTAPMAVEEDKVNKPWRPIPSGRVTQEQTRRAMLFVIPLVMAFNWAVGTWEEGMGITVLTWMYNDLGGGDELSRDVIIAIAFALFNGGSLRLSVPSPASSSFGSAAHYEISPQGYIWLAIISGVILTTMQVQDLKDQEGDRLRGRKNVPLVFGERFSRWVIAICVSAWSVACVVFWATQMMASSGRISFAALGFVVPLGLGWYVAFRALVLRGKPADARTWRLWCAWTVGLYLLPLLARLNG